MTDPNASYNITPYSFFSPILVFFVVISLIAAPAKAQNDNSFKVGVLVSMHIKPYMEALKGLREALAVNESIETGIYILDQETMHRQSAFIKELLSQNFDLFVSMGPEAISILDQMASEHDISNVYTMVLDPEKIVSSPDLLTCGISLSIPISHQIKDIRNALPHVTRLGLLFNPEENSAYFRQTSLQSFLAGSIIIPLEVSSSREIQKVLKASWNKIDGLWLIPDQTVISQTLVEFIIKEAVFHKKPVVGYNRFFYDSGAAMAFVFNFEQIGRETAGLVMAKLLGLPCEKSFPSYEVLVNKRVMKSLGMEPPED